MWQPEGGSQWFARGEYLATLLELARGTTAPRVHEAFSELDQLADHGLDTQSLDLVKPWASKYGFLDDWLVDLWLRPLTGGALAPKLARIGRSPGRR
jgi:hypothetical protein